MSIIYFNLRCSFYNIFTISLFIVRRLANERGEGNPVTSWKVHVCSENNFPTAAGLASSAAGYSCLGK